MIDSKLLNSIISDDTLARYRVEIVGYSQIRECSNTTIVLKLKQTDKTSGEVWRKDLSISSWLTYDIDEKLYDSDLKGDLREVE